jgi:hypothetical protein
MARSNVTGQLSALLSALEAQDLAQADAAAVRLAAALRRFPGGVQSISAAAFDELLRHLSSPVSERAYEVAARATCACLMAEGDDESRFAWQVCRAAGPAAALVRGIASHDAALRLRVLAALPCVFAVMLEALTEQEQHQFDTAIAKVGYRSRRQHPPAALAASASPAAQPSPAPSAPRACYICGR